MLLSKLCSDPADQKNIQDGRWWIGAGHLHGNVSNGNDRALENSLQEDAMMTATCDSVDLLGLHWCCLFVIF